MAMTVFGNPITTSTLRGTIEYAKKKDDEITRADKAKMARLLKNSRGNDFNVYKFVESIGQELPGEPVVTLCAMYNATGSTLTFVSYKNWEGRLAHSPLPFSIANGQWAGFVHINSWHDTNPSKAAVVYRGKNADGEIRDFLFAWLNPHDRSGRDNKVFTEIHLEDHYERGDTVQKIHDLLDKNGALTYEHKGMIALLMFPLATLVKAPSSRQFSPSHTMKMIDCNVF